jgi:hypothetical protein
VTLDLSRQQFAVEQGQLSLENLTLVRAPSSDSPALRVVGNDREKEVRVLRNVSGRFASLRP